MASAIGEDARAIVEMLDAVPALRSPVDGEAIDRVFPDEFVGDVVRASDFEVSLARVEDPES